jgi:hypothetical protein
VTRPGERPPVELRLSPEEALVLYDLLARFADQGAIAIVDPAEARVLWDLQCGLEKRLTEPLDPDYLALLEAARARVRGNAPR